MDKKTIKEINELYRAGQLTNNMINQLKNDSRNGVQNIIKKHQKHEKELIEKEREYLRLKDFDNQYKNNQVRYIAGIDEAGRGPLAGPVVAAAVILPEDFKLIGLTDSKQINEINRNKFYDYIINHAISYHVEVIDELTIDKINIYEATKLAMKGAYKNLKVNPDYLLIDAVNLNVKEIAYDAIIKGDAKSLSIAAASILAKVSRDKIMTEYDKIYPEYKFSKHMGYGTKDHLIALEENGVTPIHRKSFSPIRELIKTN